MTAKLIGFVTSVAAAGVGAAALFSGLALAAPGDDCAQGICRHARAAVADLVRAAANCESYCTRFSACSIERNLAFAAGPELERYRSEKAEDGRRYADWPAPEISLPTTDGRHVSLSDYRGRPVALVTLAVHCRHSLETLPLLEELRRRHEPDGLAILPVYVNSGSVVDVRDSTSVLDLSYPFLVDEEAALAEALASRMVPSVFLIDEQGFVRRKLVGFKDVEELDTALEELRRS